MRLIDETEYQELLAKIPMEERTFRKAVEVAEDMPTIDAVPVDVVAQMLCDAFGDECPCNYNGADEWLPEVCELQDECPKPKDRLGCWKQYIKHYGERKE